MVNYSPDSDRKVLGHEDGWGSTLLVSELNELAVTYITFQLFQINEIAAEDGGNYTCAPHNILPDSIFVNIMNGEGKSAAVHRDKTSSAGSVKISKLLLQVMFIVTKIWRSEMAKRKLFSKIIPVI